LRICFDAGDRFNAFGTSCHVYNGGRQEWAAWLSEFVSHAEPDHVVFFGAEREIHRVARSVAEAAGVNVIALEEGYIRPGFITVERGANNAASPIAGLMPPDCFDSIGDSARTDFKGFGAMCVHAAIYYTIRTFFSGWAQRELFHRRFNILQEAFAWVRNYWRRILHLERNFSAIERLLEHHHAHYFIVPLQVATDSQMAQAARGWNSARLVEAVLSSFAQHAPDAYHLVFKIHPIERGHSTDERQIRSVAQRLGVAHRVDVIDTGSLGLLTRHSAGMITINSTSGLSAIAHGVPLLVVGDALYANERLATCARGEPDFDAFWSGAPVADTLERRRYLAWIKASSLKRGDFYARKGMGPACQGILEKIQTAARPAVKRGNGGILQQDTPDEILEPISASNAPNSARRPGLLSVVALLLLGGCAHMPRSGPTGAAVRDWNAGDETVEKGYAVVPLDVASVRTIEAYKPEYFPTEFRDVPASGRSTRVGIGDQLKVSIWEASGDGLFSTLDKKQTDIQLVVDATGQIFIPYVGRVHAEGESVESLRTIIQDGLKGKAVQPQVQITVTGEISNSVVVVGDISRPGLYPLSARGAKLLEMIAVAGGARETTYDTVATLKRSATGGTVRLEDLIDHPENDIWLAPGDTLLLSHKPRTYAAFGAVQSTQLVPFKTRSVTLADALAQVGGLRDITADAGGVFLFRFEAGELAEKLRPGVPATLAGNNVPMIYRLDLTQPEAFFLARSFQMKDQDIIYVANHPISELGKFLQIISPLLTSYQQSQYLTQ
jgi:capsule polysaccharide modification protein KpsS/protein involved in polysaccharide export with SLBB domain